MIILPVVGNYADIDVYASIIAYADLLNQRQKAARTYIPIPPNYSVPDNLRIKEMEGKEFNLQPDDQVIILDLSDPDTIHKFVSDNQILELIDHHPGYEDYWHERLGDRAIIEKIGAVATSIFEWWGECWNYHKMSPRIAKLLLGAILDNTTNFYAEINTERDRAAAEKLSKMIGTSLDDFTKTYFNDVKEQVMKDLSKALLQDIKITKGLPSANDSFAFGQLTLWDAKDIVKDRQKIIDIMSPKHQYWLANIISIADDKNYLLSNSDSTLEAFKKVLDGNSMDNGTFVTSKVHLRKEILAKLYDAKLISV